MTPMPSNGLYAITDRKLCGRLGLVESVQQAISGGARMIQYRDKTADQERRLREATTLLELCRSSGVPLIVNDDVVLARCIGADGVHVGKEDGAVRDARRALGDEAIVGVSCYDSIARAYAAQPAFAIEVLYHRSSLSIP